MSRLPLRVRITLASAVSSALILGGLSLFVYGRLQAELHRGLDLGLRATADAVAAGIGRPTISAADLPDTGPASFLRILAPDGRPLASAGLQGPAFPAATLRAIRGPTFLQLPAGRGHPGVRPAGQRGPAGVHRRWFLAR